MSGRFYSQERSARGVRVRAHRDVSEAALDVAVARIEALLAGCERVRENLVAAGAEMHVVGKDQKVSDLPMYRHLAGVPIDGPKTIDHRRGYGGLHAVCSEESLLCLPTARHADHRDICSHEAAHIVFSFGLDDPIRSQVEERYRAAISEGRWDGAYARKNVEEYFAEATMWFVGSRGDYGQIQPRPTEGPGWLAAHDPAMFALLETIYRGQTVPAPITWEPLQPAVLRRSLAADVATTVHFVNRTDRPLERIWYDYDGAPKPYGPIAPEATVVAQTWSSHVWLVTDGDRELGVWVAGERPGWLEFDR